MEPWILGSGVAEVNSLRFSACGSVPQSLLAEAPPTPPEEGCGL